MGTIVSYYNQVFTAKYKALGFVKYKTAFAKIVGDVIQSFKLKRFSGGRECTIEFGIEPICKPVYKSFSYLFGGVYTLDQFFSEWSLWTYDPKSDSSMISCMTALSQAVDTCLLPIFDACVDCTSTFPRLLKMEELFEEKRQELLRLMNMQDMAKPWQISSLYDEKKYYMAIKLQDWEYARNHFLVWINTLDEEYEKYQLLPPSEVPADIMRRQEMRNDLAKDLHRLEVGDYEYFNEMVRINEEEFLLYMEQSYPKLIKEIR